MDQNLIIVKSLFLFNSMLNNLDEISESGVEYVNFKKKFARDFHKLADFYVRHAAEFNTEMYKHSLTGYKEAMLALDSVDDLLSDESNLHEDKHLALMLCKAKVAESFLECIDKNEIAANLFAKPLLSRMGPLLSNGVIRRFGFKEEVMNKIQNYLREDIDRTIVN